MRDLMQAYCAELARLYLPDSAAAPARLAQHLAQSCATPLNLDSGDGTTRALVMAFDRQPGAEEAQHWRLLCLVANALQTQLDLPAPAVSISGLHGYQLWLSFGATVPSATVARLLGLLRAAYFPEQTLTGNATVLIPPAKHPDTGLWAAFINPGLGASFADESGLEMAPPIAGQLALLEGLRSITGEQLARAINLLEQDHDTPLPASRPAPAPASAPMPAPGAAAPGLLLQDATLEDIVKHLHALHIEPTFRHLIQ